MSGPIDLTSVVQDLKLLGCGCLHSPKAFISGLGEFAVFVVTPDCEQHNESDPS